MMKLSVLEGAGDDQQASSVRAEIVELGWDNSQVLNQIAWTIAISGKPDDLELALRAAERASETTDHQDAVILDTLARVHYELGDLDEALGWQRKAVEFNTGHKEIDAALRTYLAEKEAKREVEEPESAQ